MKDKFYIFVFFVMLALVLTGCASAQQAGGSSTENLSLLLRQATSETQKWGNGNERNFKVYFLDYTKKDELFQAVQEAGFYQVWTSEGPRDWELGRAVLRWCVSPDIDKWSNEIQVSGVGEKTVHTYFFKSLQDSPFKNLRAAVEIQSWGDGNNRRDVTVYSFDPVKKDELFQAVKDAGFYQVGTGENPRDWNLGSAVLRWCVSPNIDKWPNEIQVSAVGEKTVHTYGFKPLQDVYFMAVENSTFPKDSGVRVIAYGGGKFVASCDGGKMAYSADGITWTAVSNSIFGTSDILRIAYGNNKFIAMGDKGQIAYSADGVTWTAVEDSTFRNLYNFTIAYGGGKFIASGFLRNAYKMAYSGDGVTWTAVKDGPFARGNIQAIAYGGGKFVAGGYGPGGNMMYSSDGVTWLASASGVQWVNNPNGSNGGGQIRSIAYGAGKFVAVGGAHNGSSWFSRVAYSTDGVIWTALENSPLTDVNAIAYGGGRFVGVGGAGRIVYSNKLE